MDDEALPRKILLGELHYAKLWLVCVALRGVSWDKMPFEQRELAFQAKDAASNCLSNLLDSPTYRAALRYAVHDTLVMTAFSGLFLLKMANLFPAELDLGNEAYVRRGRHRMREQQAAMADRALIAEHDGPPGPKAHLVVEPVEREPDAGRHHCRYMVSRVEQHAFKWRRT